MLFPKDGIFLGGRKESKDGDECNTERGRKASTARGLSDAYTSP